MNKWLYFGTGVVVGVICTFLLTAFMSEKESHGSASVAVETASKQQKKDELRDKGIVIFDKKGDVIEEKSLKVMQVIGEDAALVHGKEKDDNYDMYLGSIYLITNYEQKYYYDEQIINIPAGKVLRQIGIYNYLTRMDMKKTVPIVMIMDE